MDYRDHLSDSAIYNLQKWLREEKFAEYKPQIQKMIDNQEWKALEDAFFKVIEFGTGGRRGTTGPGSNRINRVTVGESTQALCLYSKSFDPDAPNKGIAIACDTRLSSPELSRYAAQVCAANGFKTYIFEDFRSTPELSFAVRHLGCAAGIVITASHNPSPDNGFKAYWSDGAQVVPPHDKGILQMADEVNEIHAVPDFDQAVRDGLITIIDTNVDEEYYQAVLKESLTDMRDVTVAYSPLHGAGQTNTLPVLQKAGFTVLPEKDQMKPDGNFPTVEGGKSNPEAKIANDRVVALMLAEDADIAISNDPDADRIGVMVRQGDAPIYLSGNQAAVLAADYVLKKLRDTGTLTNKHFIAKTVVTTDMLQAVADEYGATLYSNLLVGFKWIAELIKQKEDEGETFVFGAEESFGMLLGSSVRDKDGASGALPMAEAAAELKAEGKTLYDHLLELYKKHGLYLERLDTMRCEGAEGFAEMQSIMASIREHAPTQIAGEQVSAVLDYKTLKRTELSTGEQTDIDCISGDVYVLEFGDPRCRVTVRPSGTEPILKFYNQWYQQTDNPEQDMEELSAKLENMSRELEGVLLERVEK